MNYYFFKTQKICKFAHMHINTIKLTFLAMNECIVMIIYHKELNKRMPTRQY